MAWDFAAQIHALSGFDADATTSGDTGETNAVMATRWLADSAKEIMDLMPPLSLERCAKLSTAFAPTTGVITENKVISVQRAIDTIGFTAGRVFTCRQINHTMSYKAADEDSLEAATLTDPVFYFEPQTDGNAVKVKVLPASASNVAKTITIDYPSVAITDGASGITNFPDEAEYLVPIRASIYAAEHQLAIEEDPEIFLPIIQNLKQEYMQGLQALGAGIAQPQPRAQQGG